MRSEAAVLCSEPFGLPGREHTLSGISFCIGYSQSLACSFFTSIRARRCICRRATASKINLRAGCWSMSSSRAVVRSIVCATSRAARSGAMRCMSVHAELDGEADRLHAADADEAVVAVESEEAHVSRPLRGRFRRRRKRARRQQGRRYRRPTANAGGAPR